MYGEILIMFNNVKIPQKPAAASATIFPADGSMFVARQRMKVTVVYTPAASIPADSILHMTLTSSGSISVSRSTPVITDDRSSATCEFDLYNQKSDLPAGELLFSVKCYSTAKDAPTIPVEEVNSTIKYTLTSPPLDHIENMLPLVVKPYEVLDKNPAADGTTPDVKNLGVVIKLTGLKTDGSLMDEHGIYCLSFDDYDSANALRLFIYNPTDKTLGDEIFPVSSAFQRYFRIPLGTDGSAYVKIFQRANSIKNVLRVRPYVTTLYGTSYSNEEAILVNNIDILPENLGAPLVEELEGFTVTTEELKTGIHLKLNNWDDRSDDGYVIPFIKDKDNNVILSQNYKTTIDVVNHFKIMIPYTYFTSNNIYTLGCIVSDEMQSSVTNCIVFKFIDNGGGILPPDIERDLPAPSVRWTLADGRTYTVGKNEQEPTIFKKMLTDGELEMTFDISGIDVAVGDPLVLTGVINGFDDKLLPKTFKINQGGFFLKAEDIANKRVSIALDKTLFKDFDSDQYGNPGTVWIAGTFTNTILAQSHNSNVWYADIDTVAPGE